MSKPSFTAAEKYAANMITGGRQYVAEETGERLRLCQREWMLVCFLERIADGSVSVRGAKARIAEVLGDWKKRVHKEDPESLL